MKVVYEPDAEEELGQAIDFLVRQSGVAEFGERLLVEVARCEQAILQFPRASPKTGRGFRRHLLRRFPYQIIYRIEDSVIRVVAFAHLKRRPGYWRGRVNT